MRAMSCETQLRSALALPFAFPPRAWSLETGPDVESARGTPTRVLEPRPPEKNLFRHIFE